MDLREATRLFGVVLQVVLLLVVPGEPRVVAASGYVLLVLLFGLAVVSAVRRWALVVLAVLQGLLGLSGVIAATGPTRSVQLAAFAVLAVVVAMVSALDLRQHSSGARLTTRRP